MCKKSKIFIKIVLKKKFETGINIIVERQELNKLED